MSFSVLTRKGQVRRHNSHPLRSSSDSEEVDLSWWLPQSQIPLDPDGLSLLRESGIQEPASPSGSSGHPNGDRSHRPVPLQMARPFKSQRQRREIGSPPPQGLGPTSGCLLVRAPGALQYKPPACSLSPNSPASQRPGELESPIKMPGPTSTSLHLTATNDH